MDWKGHYKKWQLLTYFLLLTVAFSPQESLPFPQGFGVFFFNIFRLYRCVFKQLQLTFCFFPFFSLKKRHLLFFLQFFVFFPLDKKHLFFFQFKKWQLGSPGTPKTAGFPQRIVAGISMAWHLELRTLKKHQSLS